MTPGMAGTIPGRGMSESQTWRGYLEPLTCCSSAGGIGALSPGGIVCRLTW
jgi:hypothetical protein